MEELQRVLRPEPEREPGVAERLRALSISCERPREHLVAFDRGPLSLCEPGQSERLPQLDAMVDAEQRGLEVGSNAVRKQQPIDHRDQAVLSRRSLRTPGQAVEVSQRADELGQWHVVRRPSLEVDRAAQVPTGGLGLRQSVEGVDVAGKNRESRPVLLLCRTYATGRPVELAELPAGPGRWLGFS